MVFKSSVAVGVQLNSDPTDMVNEESASQTRSFTILSQKI